MSSNDALVGCEPDSIPQDQKPGRRCFEKAVISSRALAAWPPKPLIAPWWRSPSSPALLRTGTIDAAFPGYYRPSAPLFPAPSRFGRGSAMSYRHGLPHLKKGSPSLPGIAWQAPHPPAHFVNRSWYPDERRCQNPPEQTHSPANLVLSAFPAPHRLWLLPRRALRRCYWFPQVFWNPGHRATNAGRLYRRRWLCFWLLQSCGSRLSPVDPVIPGWWWNRSLVRDDQDQMPARKRFWWNLLRYRSSR